MESSKILQWRGAGIKAHQADLCNRSHLRPRNAHKIGKDVGSSGSVSESCAHNFNDGRTNTYHQDNHAATFERDRLGFQIVYNVKILLSTREHGFIHRLED